MGLLSVARSLLGAVLVLAILSICSGQVSQLKKERRTFYPVARNGLTYDPNFSNEIDASSTRKGWNIWDNKIFRKISRFFKWNRNKFEKRTSFIKRKNPSPKGYLIPPRIKRKKERLNNDKKTAIHPYEFVMPGRNAATLQYSSTRDKISEKVSLGREEDDLTTDPILQDWDPPPYREYTHKQKSFPKKNYETKKLPFVKRLSISTDNASQVPTTRERVPAVAHFPAGRSNFNVPKHKNKASFPISSGLSFHKKNTKPLSTLTKNIPSENKRTNGFFNRLSSFTNMLDGILPKPFSNKKTAKSNSRRRKISSPIPRPVRLPHKSKTNKIEAQERNAMNFEPSPQEGSFTADAFQPIFVPSQSLETVMESNAMKPMIIAESRISPKKKAAPSPPEIIDFF